MRGFLARASILAGVVLLLFSGTAMVRELGTDPSSATAGAVTADRDPARDREGGRDRRDARRTPRGTAQDEAAGRSRTRGDDRGAVKRRGDRSDGRGRPQPLRKDRRTAIEKPLGTVRPESLSIPVLGIEQDLTELAVIGEELQVPDDYDDIGWWRDGPAPGRKGAAVMVGHVDSATGPAVFYRLSALRPKDRIKVTLEDGSRALFTVRTIEVYDRSRFPDERVFRSTGKPTLHLLTCGGEFDAAAGAYDSNVVVYADLADRVPAPTAKPARRATKPTRGGTRG